MAMSAVMAGCSSNDVSSPSSISPVNTHTSLPQLKFVDITEQAALQFKLNLGASGLKLMPESMGSGAAFIDYDGDGFQDIFVVNARDWTDEELELYRHGRWSDKEVQAFKKQYGSGAYRPGMPRRIPKLPERRRTTCALYRNNRDGTFSDVTRGSGLEIQMYGMGAAVGDYDNDGKADLYVTGWGRNYLFHNQSRSGRVQFREIAQLAGLQDRGWSTSAMWVDYDRDGHLDLFVCHYVNWTPAIDGADFESLTGRGKSYTGPTLRRGEANRLYRNMGNGRFEDVTLKAGIVRSTTALRRDAPGTSVTESDRDKQLQSAGLVGKSLGVVLCDINKDYWPDILVTNDTRRNFLFINNKQGGFTETGIAAGIAYAQTGQARAGMGVDAADIDHTDRESFVIGNFSKEMIGLYHNQGDGTFLDVAPAGEVGRASMYSLTFGLAFVDVDNDGLPDILAANGHVMDDIERSKEGFAQGVTYAQRPLLFRNLGGKQFREIGLHTGPAMSKPIVARGLACADIDLDGDADVLFTVANASPVLLRNDGGNHNNSIRVVLRGDKSNRSAIGAVVKVKLKNTGLRRTVKSGSSYLSQSELPLTLGLGREEKAELLSIRWPSGAAVQFENVAANQILVIDEKKGIISRKPFLSTR
jgi:hypothetical protein